MTEEEMACSESAEPLRRFFRAAGVYPDMSPAFLQQGLLQIS